jgi:hypothetical protein
MDFKKLLSKEFFAAVLGLAVVVLTALELSGAVDIICSASAAFDLAVAGCVAE